MKNFYLYISSFFANLFQTTSTFILYLENLITLNFKSFMLILFLIIVNKPFIVLLLNVTISFIIRSIFISNLYADEERFLYEQMNDVETEPGEPIYLSMLFKGFFEGLIWFMIWDPPRPHQFIFLLPELPYPTSSLNHPELPPDTPLPPSRPFLHDRPSYLPCEFPKPPVTRATTPLTLSMQSSHPDPDSYQMWVDETSKPFLHSLLLRELHLKLESCNDKDQLFYASLDFIKAYFPSEKWARNLDEFNDPNSPLNFT